MPNWSLNSVAFYQEDGGNAMLEAFYADIQKYQGYKDPETGNYCDWVGNWLESNRINTDNLYTRGFFIDCEFEIDHVRVDMEVAWSTMTDVYDLMAKKYDLDYVYIAEEAGCEFYVNTDTEGRFFPTRYIFHYFDVEDLRLDSRIMAEYGERIQELSGETHYYDSWKEVVSTFKSFQFQFKDINELNKCLEIFNLAVHEYSNE